MEYLIENHLFVSLLLVVFFVEYLTVRIETWKDKDRPSLIWVPMYTLATVLMTELVVFLIQQWFR